MQDTEFFVGSKSVIEERSLAASRRSSTSVFRETLGYGSERYAEKHGRRVYPCIQPFGAQHVELELFAVEKNVTWVHLDDGMRAAANPARKQVRSVEQPCENAFARSAAVHGEAGKFADPIAL